MIMNMNTCVYIVFIYISVRMNFKVQGTTKSGVCITALLGPRGEI